MNHTRRNWWQVLAALVAFTLIAAACGDGGAGADAGESAATDTTRPPEGLYGGDDDQDAADDAVDDGPEYGGNLVVALEAETDQWTPGYGYFSVSSNTVNRALYDSLTSLSVDGEIEPFLAESVEPNNNLDTWTVTLRSGVEFHDGSPLDAETLVWNFETLHNQPESTSYGPIQEHGIEAVEATGPLTVEYRLRQSNAAFPSVLRTGLGIPVSRQSYEEMGHDTFGENPVGTGPFEFQQWTRDDQLVLSRNQNYWRSDEDGNRLPYLDQLVFRPIPDEGSRYQSLASDAVQVMVTLRGSSGKQVIDLAEERNYRADLSVVNESGMSLYNLERPPVDDVRVRRALTASSDAEEVAVILGDDGLAPLTNQFFSPDNRWYSERAAEAYVGFDGPDLDYAAEQLLDYIDDPDRSDGKDPGEPIDIEFACPADPSLIEIGQLYQQLWSEVLGGGGLINVSLRQVDQPTLIGNAINGDYVVTCWRAGADEGDPLLTLQSFFSDPENNILNFNNFSSPELDEALDDLRRNYDFEVRYEAAERINVIVNENALITWSLATPHVVGFRDDLVGLTSWKMPSGNEGRGTRGAILDFSQVYLR